MDPSAKDLIQRLLTKDPTKRLGSGPDGAENVKKHPFYQVSQTEPSRTGSRASGETGVFWKPPEHQLGGPGGEEGPGPVQARHPGRAGRQQLRGGVHGDGPHLLPRGAAPELRPHLSGGWRGVRGEPRQIAGLMRDVDTDQKRFCAFPALCLRPYLTHLSAWSDGVKGLWRLL